MKNLIYFILLLLPFTIHAQEICGDGLDNDGDNLIDCADVNCAGDNACQNAIACLDNSVFYQVLNGSSFNMYDPITLTYTLIANNSYEINAIGYNVQDGFIYGIIYSPTNSSLSNHLVSVGADGIFNDLGAVTNLPTSIGYYLGDFDLSGNLYVYRGSDPNMYRIDVSNLTATAVTLSQSFIAADFSFLPATGNLYSLTNTTSQLVEINPITGNVQNQGSLTPTLPTCNGYGASFADNNGSLYFFCNASGDLFQVDAANGTSSLLQATGINLSTNDGAACPLSDSLVVTVSEGEYCCDGENLINNGNFEQGDVGFSSQYNSVPAGGNVPPGSYSVIDYNIANTICTNWDIEDHTHCITGSNNNILVVNGQSQQSSNANNVIWQTDQAVTIEVGSQYKFCAYLQHLPQCCFDITPRIRIEINNGSGWTVLNNWTTLISGAAPCGWVEVGGTFTASSSSIQIRILINELGNGDGNDLAIDDISLIKKEVPQFTITVNETVPSNPLIINGSIFSGTSADDILPSPECDHLWAIVEVTDLSPFTEDWGQTLVNGWFGGSAFGQAWGLTTNFAGINLPGDKLYRVYFWIYNCDCYEDTRVFEYSGGGFGFKPTTVDCLISQGSQQAEYASINQIDNYFEIMTSGEITDEIKEELLAKAEEEQSVQQSSDNIDIKIDCETKEESHKERAIPNHINAPIQNSKFIISPNPFNNSFNINFSRGEDSPQAISVLNAQGKEVYNNLHPRTNEQIDLKEMPSGIYIISIKYQNEVISQKLIKGTDSSPR